MDKINSILCPPLGLIGSDRVSGNFAYQIESQLAVPGDLLRRLANLRGGGNGWDDMFEPRKITPTEYWRNVVAGFGLDAGIVNSAGTPGGNDMTEGGSEEDAMESSNLAEGGDLPGATGILKRSGPLGWLLEGVQKIFGSAHVPNWAMMPFIKVGTLEVGDVKAAAKQMSFQRRDKQTGSYTIEFSDGHKYHGKGPVTRMATSAIEKMIAHDVMVTSLDWRPATSNRQAFKDEYRRMQTDATRLFPQGVDNPVNYNIIQSPGKRYIEQDGY